MSIVTEVNPQQTSNLSAIKHASACLVCQSHYHFPLYCWENMPLSVVGLSTNHQEAKHQANLTMDLHRCCQCGHVFHAEFDPEAVAYHQNSNLVYNKGQSWQQYQDDLAEEWADNFYLHGECVVEIGCGEGFFLQRFLAFDVECIGFEPGNDASRAKANGIKVVPEYFTPEHVQQTQCTAIICRHVIEHLADPLNFLQGIAVASQGLEYMPLFLAEVPLIDKALEQFRINDFLYEHVSNFTFNSFRVLFERAGFEILEHKARYQDEVITIVARPIKQTNFQATQQASQSFTKSVTQQITRVQAQINDWKVTGKHIALWAATGKGAAFINMFNISEECIATIIDSDSRKFDHFVPGTGQRIQAPNYLKNNPADVIIICSNWHARDIEQEIRQNGFDAEIYVYFNQQLTPLTDDLLL